MSTARRIHVKVARLRTGFAGGGLEYLLTAALSYLPSRLVQYRHHVLVRCAAGMRGRLRPPGATIRDATPTDARQLVGQGDITSAEIEGYFARGDVCAVAIEEDRVLATAWASRGTQYLVRLCLEFAIPDDAFYLHDTFTRPGARRRGLASLCYDHLFAQLAAEGRITAYAAVEVLNHGSRRTHARWGFVPVGRTRTLDVGPLRITSTPHWPVPTRRLSLRWMGRRRDGPPLQAPAPPPPPRPAGLGSGSTHRGRAPRSRP